jgi:hypothetical protein
MIVDKSKEVLCSGAADKHSPSRFVRDDEPQHVSLIKTQSNGQKQRRIEVLKGRDVQAVATWIDVEWFGTEEDFESPREVTRDSSTIPVTRNHVLSTGEDPTGGATLFLSFISFPGTNQVSDRVVHIT